MEGNKESYPEILTRPREDTTEDVASIHGLTFYDFKLRKELNMAIIKHGFKQPSPIQEEAIPAILAGKSVVAKAKNGIGKTAAFAIPLIQLCDLSDESIQTLILVPTRELAAQHQQEFTFLSQYIPNFVKPILLIGGVQIEEDKYRLEKKPRIAICTPGRCRDLMRRDLLKLNRVRHVVLDEADRLLYGSFKDTVNEILSLINKPVARSHKSPFRRTSADTIVSPSENDEDQNELGKMPQMLLFSATFPESLSSFVKKIPNCQEIVIKYKNHSSGNNEDSEENDDNNGEKENSGGDKEGHGHIKKAGKSTTKEEEEEEGYNQLVIVGVSHHYLLLSGEKEKVTALLWLFQNIEIHQSIIFVSSRERAEKLCSVLRECMAREYGVNTKESSEDFGIPFAVLHSGMSTENRLAVLGMLRSGKVRHLIATDVGTRGLDSSLVNVVINFDMPDGGGTDSGTGSRGSFGAGASKDYLHRIGRCGRFGGRGKAISFIVNDSSTDRVSTDLMLLFKIERELKITIHQISADEPIE